MASTDSALTDVHLRMRWRHPIRSRSACPERGRVGAERLAAASPPRAHGGVRHVEVLSDGPQPQIGQGLQRHPAADDRHFEEPSREHQVRQQRVRASTDTAATTSNPDPFDQQRRPQPPPIPSPAHEPCQAGGTAQRRRDDGLASCRIARRRQRARPCDDHRGACTTLPALFVGPRLRGPLYSN